MIYGRYKDARDAAWRCLLDYNINVLPVDILGIAKQAGVKVIKNSTVGALKLGEAGAAIFNGEKWYIVYDDAMSAERCRFTVAHEIGHIFLGHATRKGYHARTIDKDKPEVESEADVFASRLLAPACVLWGLNIHSATDIADICRISYQAAEIRAQRMEILYKRNKFLTSPLECKVYEKFKRFIDDKKKMV